MLPNCFGICCLYPLGHEKGFDIVGVFEVHLDTQNIAGIFEIFPKSFCVGYHYGKDFVVGSIAVGVVVLVPSGS